MLREHVTLQRAHEEQRGCRRISSSKHAGFGRALEVIDHEPQPPPRRTVFGGRVEGQENRRATRVLVHRQHEAGGDHALHERNEAFCEIAKNDASIAVRGVDGRQVEHALRRLNVVGPLHRGAKESFLGGSVTEKGCRGDAQLRCDLGKRRGRESLGREDTSGTVQQLIAADGRRSAHL